MGKKFNRDRATNVRLDGMTPEEQEKMTEHIMRGKRELAPESRVTIVEGSERQLSSGHVKQLESENE